jgi:DNA-binding transcriptional LysR family regulator
MDVRSLRYFVEVVRRDGFTRASESLHVSQPAISKMVRSLEEEIGVPLLVRARRRVTLTEAGQVVFDRAQGVLDAVRAIEEEVGELSAMRRGRLRVGLPPMVGMAFFPLVLAEFRRLHPGVTLELREQGARHIEALVRKGELDVGATVLPTDEATLATLPFVEDELWAVLHRDHPLAARSQLALSELEGHPFILHSPEFALHAHILDACRQCGFAPTVVSESSQWNFIVAMVAADVGVALLPGTICRRLGPRQVATVRITDPTIPWNLALVWRRDHYLPAATRAWLDVARRRLGGAQRRVVR